MGAMIGFIDRLVAYLYSLTPNLRVHVQVKAIAKGKVAEMELDDDMERRCAISTA